MAGDFDKIVALARRNPEAVRVLRRLTDVPSIEAMAYREHRTFENEEAGAAAFIEAVVAGGGRVLVAPSGRTEYLVLARR